ncbi:MAG: hypothetical protein ACXWYP_07145 [Pseudonocardia sp.]
MLDLYYPVSAVMWIWHTLFALVLGPASELAWVGPTDAAMRVMRATPWIFPLGVLLGGLFAAFPIAILLHWLTNNLWTLVQQRIVFPPARRRGGRPPGPGRGAGDRRAGVRRARAGLNPGAKPLTARRLTSAASRTGGKAAAGRHGGTRRR